MVLRESLRGRVGRRRIPFSPALESYYPAVMSSVLEELLPISISVDGFLDVDVDDAKSYNIGDMPGITWHYVAIMGG